MVPDVVRTQHGPGLRARKTRPGTPYSRDATPMAQLGGSLDRPQLSVGTVRDRCYGHGRQGRRWIRPGSNGHQLDRRVRPVLGNHSPGWQAADAARQPDHTATSGGRKRRRPFQGVAGQPDLQPVPRNLQQETRFLRRSRQSYCISRICNAQHFEDGPWAADSTTIAAVVASGGAARPDGSTGERGRRPRGVLSLSGPSLASACCRTVAGVVVDIPGVWREAGKVSWPERGRVPLLLLVD
jgi:hypothetical protein